MNGTVKKDNKWLVWDIVIVGAILAFIVLSFFTFTRSNRRRIVQQNNSLIQDATEQKAARLDELLDSSQRGAEMMASLNGQVTAGREVDADLLRDMEDRTPVDYVEFISADGTDLNSEGRTADLSDRDYFLEGMKGNSGRSVIYNSRITNETLVTFYAPFYREGRIEGVLSCILRGQTILDILSSDYYGVQGNAYLLARDGRVILSTVENAPENLLASLRENGRVPEKDLEKLEMTLDDTNDVDFTGFNFSGSNGAGSRRRI